MLAKTYRIETERLVIRCYQPNDAEFLKASIDESLEHLLPWMPWAKNEPETITSKVERLRECRGQFDLGIDYTFGIFNKEETQLIGSIGLHTRLEGNAREIGYWINAKFLREGYATETVQALIKVGFEVEKLDRIEIRCTPENIVSQRVPMKLGFTHEGTLRKRTIDTSGKPRDVMIWTRFQSDYIQDDHPDFYFKAFNVVGEQII
ncbi:MAG: GNAT family protein [Bacteroidota bacterium]